ncbi:hypothetical protein FRB95_010660 [Tulasnella sp. JGI-2019a]|nr:hypothetical protein FRB95_010660 [Tulasnella sp. JGI-2019a]
MATDEEMNNPQSEFDLGRVHSAHLVSQDAVDSPANGDSTAADKEPVVQVILSLSKADAERLLKNMESTNSSVSASGDGVPAPSSPDTVAAKSATSSNRRTSSRLKATDTSNINQTTSEGKSSSTTVGRTTRSAATTNGNGPATPKPSATATAQAPAPTPPVADVVVGPTPVELQGMHDTERSYTNAFHKTLSLFVDDKTFSTPSLRAAVVGFLESSNATVLEILPQHNHSIPDHLKQEIENHVNLIRTVLQRGGVFAEDFLRSRLKKLSTHIPRLEAALAANDPSRRTSSKAPVLVARSNDPYSMNELDPTTAAATQAALAQAAEAAARSNNRHHQMLAEARGGDDTDMGVPPHPDQLPHHQQHHLQQHPHEQQMNMVDANGYGLGAGPPPMGGMMPLPPPPGMGGMPPLPRGKTFVPPSLVPGGQQGPPPPPQQQQQQQQQMGGPPRGMEGEGGDSPPPVLAPFDPRPNPMACLFCRQRKIRCIGHKPHPCEICVKRGFVCSYDWISRRGKRKPKGSDGSPLDMPSGSVTVASMEQGLGPTVGGVPVNGMMPGQPGMGVGVPGGPPPIVGMHPQHPGGPPPPPPGMHHPHPGMQMGMPGQPDGMPPFTYTFMPGHPGGPGGPFVPGPPPHHMGVPGQDPQQQHYPPPQHQQQQQGQLEYMGESSGVSSGVESPAAQRVAAGEAPADDGAGGGIMIDPSLMEPATATENGNGNAAAITAESSAAPGANGNSAEAGACQWCKDQDLPCGGQPPAPCNNCVRREQQCEYPRTSKRGGGNKKAGEATAVATRKSKRTSEPAGGAKKKQRVSAGAKKQAAAAAAQENNTADEGGDGDGEGDIDADADMLSGGEDGGSSKAKAKTAA